MAERRKIRTFVDSLKRYDISYGCTLPQFLAQIDKIVESIPTDQRDGIVVDWTDGDDCDSGYIEFEHFRDETDEEMASRLEREKAAALARSRERETQERKSYELLRKKYG